MTRRNKPNKTHLPNSPFFPFYIHPNNFFLQVAREPSRWYSFSGKEAPVTTPKKKD
jgi:hypothetical protein